DPSLPLVFPIRKPQFPLRDFRRGHPRPGPPPFAKPLAPDPCLPGVFSRSGPSSRGQEGTGGRERGANGSPRRLSDALVLQEEAGRATRTNHPG
ncbi:MAG TPA: hypothetical protein VLB09_00265, partial [Nitrospiria bacterium]|nr:hypothetical protein [Nitrospiria bacterium]